jgi:hypothetical protein
MVHRAIAYACSHANWLPETIRSATSCARWMPEIPRWIHVKEELASTCVASGVFTNIEIIESFVLGHRPRFSSIGLPVGSAGVAYRVVPQQTARGDIADELQLPCAVAAGGQGSRKATSRPRRWVPATFSIAMPS